MHNAFKDQTAPTAFNHVRQRVEKSKAPGEKYDIMFTAVVPTEVGIAQKKVNCSEIDVVLFISHEIRLQIEVLLRDPLWLVHELMQDKDLVAACEKHGFLIKASPEYNERGDRVYSELNTGRHICEMS